MKKTALYILAALAVMVSCKEKEPEAPSLSVGEKSVVIENAGGSQSVSVTANNPWTAEVTSGADWLSVSSSSESFIVTALENTGHQNRMGAVKVTSSTLSEVVSVIQLAAPNNDKIEVSPVELVFEADGGSKNVTVKANVEVKATPGDKWVTVTPPASQSAQMTYSIKAEAFTGAAPRETTVTFTGGDANAVTVKVSQNPAAFITPSQTAITAPAEGSETTVKVTSNVSWTASSSEGWVTVSPASGQNTDIKITVSTNNKTEKRTATVTLKADKATATIAIEQEAMVVTESLLAAWRCDDAAYTDSHSPDWSTAGANATSNGTGKGIALPEDGAPAGTQMTWVRSKELTFALVFITAAEGHYAVKAVAEGDGFLFTIPGQTFKKGQVLSIDCGIASGANSAPKNWVAKFRTSESADWTIGDCTRTYTTGTGATAHLLITKQKDYTENSRFLASYTFPEDVTAATVQIFVCAADAETLKGTTTSGATIRLIPLYGASGSIEYPGPRILIR